MWRTPTDCPSCSLNPFMSGLDRITLTQLALAKEIAANIFSTMSSSNSPSQYSALSPSASPESYPATQRLCRPDMYVSCIILDYGTS